MKSLRLADSNTVMRLNGRHISELPDDVVCYMLTLLPLREAVRARSLSARWRYLPECRTVLQFDALNVFGSEQISCDIVNYKSRFVRAVDEFLESWRGRDLCVFKVQFSLGNEYASHIDQWIRRIKIMKIEELEVNLSFVINRNEKYVFPCHLLQSEKGFYLKRLHLESCALTLSSGCTSWISHLTTLQLSHVPLNQSDIECILSNGLNLTLLSLTWCSVSANHLNVKLPSLKELVICGSSLYVIELSCPNLEIFKYVGRARNFIFTLVPLMREVNVWHKYCPGGCSLIFDGLTSYAPKLKALSLLVMTEVLPLPSNRTMSCLKRLDIQTLVSIGFDLCTITHFLKASPFLEILHLKMKYHTYTKQSPHREYPDCPHFHLKEVTFDGFCNKRSEIQLAQHLLRNAVALHRMVILFPWEETSESKEIATILLQNEKTTAELVIRGQRSTLRSDSIN